MTELKTLKDFDNVDRREHGCDGCRKNVPTERFDGYCGHYLWLCNECFRKLVMGGLIQLKNKSKDANKTIKSIREAIRKLRNLRF